MNTNRDPKNNPSKLDEPRTKVSFPNELLWAFIGLLLTIFGTFVEAFITTPPWTWMDNGVHSLSLGVKYQIGAVLLTGCLGGKNAGVLSQIAYVLLGLAWMPVFAHGGGVGYWHEPTFGYILGFIPGAWLCGRIAFRTRAKLESLALSALSGLGIIHLCGLMYLIGLSFVNSSANKIIAWANLPEMIMNYSIVPLPGQLVIVCAVTVIAFIVRQVLFY